MKIKLLNKVLSLVLLLSVTTFTNSCVSNDDLDDPQNPVSDSDPVAKVDLPEGTNLKPENLTIIGDGEEIDVNKDGTFSSEPANLVAFNSNDQIVYLSYGSGNEERVLGPLETALALLLPTIPNVVTEFDAQHLQAFKVMVALLKPTYNLSEAIKKSIAEYNYLNMDAIQPELLAAVRELQQRCGFDKESLTYASKASFSPRNVNSVKESPDYPYFTATNSKKAYWDFITVQMTDAKRLVNGGTRYWSCTFDVYNDNRFCYTSFTKSLKTDNGFIRYDNSWADTFRYLIKPYNLSEFMDLGLLSDIAYDPEHFLTTLRDYDYSKIYEDKAIAQFWEPLAAAFSKDKITTFDKTVTRGIKIDLFAENEHLCVVGPGWDDNLLLFNLAKIFAQPILKMIIKSETKDEDLDKFTEGFIKWVAEIDLTFRADLLQHIKDPNYSYGEKIIYVIEKLTERIIKYVRDKLYDAASEVMIKRMFGKSFNSKGLEEYKAVMNTLKTGYKVGDMFQLMLDAQYRGFSIEVEKGYVKEDNHEYVDLGLPSGLLWATCNVGASKPEEYGDYFAWGETKPKSDYSWSTYKWGSGYDQLTKYCTKSSYGLNGFTDNKTSLDLADDAARANWGGQWRMPTSADFSELLSNTSNQWVTNYNGTGVNGRLFTASNGKTLFLPAAGYRFGTSLNGAGSRGYYWSSSLSSSSPDDAYYLNFYSGGVYVYYYYRNDGHAVRPVRSKN